MSLDMVRCLRICTDSPMAKQKAFTIAVAQMKAAFERAGFTVKIEKFNKIENAIAIYLHLFCLARFIYSLRLVFIALMKKEVLFVRSYRLIMLLGLVYAVCFRRAYLIFECHDISSKSFYFNWLKFALRQADLTIFLTKSMQNYIGCNKGIVLHNVADLKIFDEASSLSSPVFDKDGLCYFGALQSAGIKKGVDDFLLPMLEAGLGKYVHIEIYSHDDASDIKTEIATRPEGESVVFNSALPHNQVFAEMKKFSFGFVGCHVNKQNMYFSSPLKIFEYIAAGLIVLAPDFEAIREIDESGDFIIFFNPTEKNWEKTLLNKLKTMDKKERESRRLSGMTQAKQYSWDNRVSNIINHLRLN